MPRHAAGEIGVVGQQLGQRIAETLFGQSFISAQFDQSDDVPEVGRISAQLGQRLADGADRPWIQNECWPHLKRVPTGAASRFIAG